MPDSNVLPRVGVALIHTIHAVMIDRRRYGSFNQTDTALAKLVVMAIQPKLR